ncbi:Transposase (or an inactivated derivative) [Caloranaerobacter azorensis DSM 13643]|uniref:Mutator family transposase n=1 Tax=Caloranaerobacter azorensis DSM 13643 TaxID=1121264 RepID=A0A1M5VIE5_9FIRM|nr:IS256 family transposase [Caloranaerobacter azorensis]SHH74854.1 Transposase (or an inactivated derivative) [Caloranaerobacter azorensis DSM 13643]
MSTLKKETLREMIREGNLTTAQDLHSFLKDLFKDALQEMLEAELEVELGYAKGDRKNKQTDNRRNGYTDKKVKTQFGEMQIEVPRDRNGEFEPIVVPKNKRDISGIEEKVISLYARGMTTRDIHDQIKDIYGIQISAEMVSKITDKLLPQIQEWQNRPLEPIYPFVFMDAIHYKVREDGQIKNKAAYVVLGINLEGFKDILGIWIGESESSKFWLGILNELKNRGVKDILIFSVDGLTGLKETIGASFPKSEIQRCIIHQLRNSFKYVPYKDLKEFTTDFKEVYTAVNEETAYSKLQEIEEKWGKKYPFAIKSWYANWEVLSPFFKFTAEIRRIMYTTNIIESLHRQFRKVTKTKTIFPSDKALYKILYLASQNVMKKWTVRYKNWDIVINQLMIFFEGRIESYL